MDTGKGMKFKMTSSNKWKNEVNVSCQKWRATNAAEKKTDIWTKCLWSVCLYYTPTQIYEFYHSLKPTMTWWWWWWLFKCHLHREDCLPSLSEMTTPLIISALCCFMIFSLALTNVQHTFYSSCLLRSLPQPASN